MGKSERQASDGDKQEIGERWGRVGGYASNGGEPGTGE